MKKCRICKSKTKRIVSFGKMALSTFTKKPQGGRKYPLDLVLCKKCGLLQLSETMPKNLLYSDHYWYRSGINAKIVKDLKDIVKKSVKLVKFKKGDIFLDIGANDGTLLKFVPKKFRRVGVEPAKNLLSELKKNSDIIIQDFWENVRFEKKAKIITAIGMFYDSENPNLFIKNVEKHLADDGIFVAQLMTLIPMIKNNDIGNVCHEHLEYYSYETLKYLFKLNGLEIFGIEINDINGGSYRVFGRKIKNGSKNFVEPFVDYDKWVREIKKNKVDTVKFIRQAKKLGKKVYGYGASTKGNTILQYYGLTNKDITAIADANPEKYGLYTIGSKIPIVSEKEARKDADYFFILPYSFLNDFISREKHWLNNGGHFIVSIPDFQII